MTTNTAPALTINSCQFILEFSRKADEYQKLADLKENSSDEFSELAINAYLACLQDDTLDGSQSWLEHCNSWINENIKQIEQELDA